MTQQQARTTRTWKRRSNDPIRRPRWTPEEDLSLLVSGLRAFMELQGQDPRHTKQASLIRLGQLRQQVDAARYRP